MNFEHGILWNEEKKKLKSWLEFAAMKKDYEDAELNKTIKRLEREIKYAEQYKQKSPTPPDESKLSHLDFKKFENEINYLTIHGMTISDESLTYGKPEDFSGVDLEKLRELLEFFSNKVHTEDILYKELYEDRVDAYNRGEDTGEYFFPLERFIFKKYIDETWYLFDYYEISGQGTETFLAVYREGEEYEKFVENMMKVYYLDSYSELENKMIEC